MPYRDDVADVVEATTAEGPFRLDVAPRRVRLTGANKTLHVEDRFAHVVDGKRRVSVRVDGRIVVARHAPREDLAVWLEATDGMRRVFGVEPASLLTEAGISALATLDRLAQRLRAAVDGATGVEVGRGADKALLVDGQVWARKLFRDRAELVLTAHEGGRVEIPGRTPFVVEPYGITVVGDYVRFADDDGTDLARVAIPWIAAEDRAELARRLGQRIASVAR